VQLFHTEANRASIGASAALQALASSGRMCAVSLPPSHAACRIDTSIRLRAWLDCSPERAALCAAVHCVARRCTVRHNRSAVPLDSVLSVNLTRWADYNWLLTRRAFWYRHCTAPSPTPLRPTPIAATDPCPFLAAAALALRLHAASVRSAFRVFPARPPNQSWGLAASFGWISVPGDVFFAHVGKRLTASMCSCSNSTQCW
jgi:hypothetical protein